MYGRIRDHLAVELNSIREAGFSRAERVIASAQGALITLADGRRVLNFCSNDYLGLSGAPSLAESARRALAARGFGMASARFACGTTDLHRELEQRLAHFVGAEDALLFPSCSAANGGVFEPLFGEQDVILGDQLNHASLIDGMRLCRARKVFYRHADMDDLEARLAETSRARFRLIATDGVFPMDSDIALLPEICSLAEKYDALVLADESHATGFVGPTGRGTPEHLSVQGRVDIVTGTLSKALGGAIGGFVAAHREIVDTLRSLSHPYLYSNSLPPMVIGASIAVLDQITASTALRDRLEQNTRHFREGMTAAGFDLKPGVHPIVPVMLYDAALSQRITDELLAEQVMVAAFFYPVVPAGEARIRVQISAAHERTHLERAIDAFARVGRKHGIVR